MSRQALHNFVRELERLYNGELTEAERLAQAYSREVSVADAIGTFTDVRYISDQFCNLLGVQVDCKNDYGKIFIDTLEQSAASGCEKVRLPEEIAEEITNLFAEIRFV